MADTVVSMARFKVQEAVDTFYWSHGPCCSGCDHWQHYNSVCGDCTKSAPVAGHERLAMLGLHSPSLCPGAGHVMTNRAHRCGYFVDSFNWNSLSAAYLQRIGFKGKRNG